MKLCAEYWIDNLTLFGMQNLCRKYGLCSKGSKVELAERLVRVNANPDGPETRIEKTKEEKINVENDNNSEGNRHDAARDMVTFFAEMKRIGKFTAAEDQDVEEWFDDFDRIAEFCDLNQLDKFVLLRMHLDGLARKCYSCVSGPRTYSNFRAALVKEFGVRPNSIEALRRLCERNRLKVEKEKRQIEEETQPQQEDKSHSKEREHQPEDLNRPVVQMEEERSAKNESGGLVANKADEPDEDTSTVSSVMEIRKEFANEEQNAEEEEHFEPERHVLKIDVQEEVSDEEMEVFGGNKAEETTEEEIADQMTEENYKSEEKFYEEFELENKIEEEHHLNDIKQSNEPKDEETDAGMEAVVEKKTEETREKIGSGRIEPEKVRSLCGLKADAAFILMYVDTGWVDRPMVDVACVVGYTDTGWREAVDPFTIEEIEDDRCETEEAAEGKIFKDAVIWVRSLVRRVV